MGGGLKDGPQRISRATSLRGLFQNTALVSAETAGNADAAGSALQGGNVAGFALHAARAVKGVVGDAVSRQPEAEGVQGPRGSLEHCGIDCSAFQKTSVVPEGADEGAEDAEKAAGLAAESPEGGGGSRHADSPQGGKKPPKGWRSLGPSGRRAGAAAFSEESSSTTSRVSADMAPNSSGHYAVGRDVVARLEYLTANQTKAAYLFLWSTTVVGLAFLLYNFTSKITRGDGVRNVPIINVVMGTVCAAALSTALVVAAWRYTHVYLQGKVWKRRRLYSSCLVMAELSFQSLNTVAFIIPNALILAEHCDWGTNVLPWTGLIQWTCWNSIFLIYSVLAHNGTPIKRHLSPEVAKQQVKAHGPGALYVLNKAVIDLPITVHAPKLLLWVVTEGFVIATTTVYGTGKGSAVSTKESLDGQTTSPHGCRDIHLALCNITHVEVALTSCTVACIYVYVLLILFFVARGLRRLRTLPRADYRIANMLIRLQIRTRVVVVLFYALSLALLWWVDMNRCSSFAYTWPGMLPVQIAATGMVLTWLYLIMPRPITTEPLQVWLQEFAWTEDEKPLKLEIRNTLVSGANTGLENEAMFCFETCCNLLAWSVLAYDYREVTSSALSLEKAMALYGLKHAELIWERQRDTKLLLAWSDRTLVAAFRGTASLANALSDLQAWRCIHPPKRGSFWRRPRVHKGFFRAWTTNGLRDRVMERLREIHQSRASVPDACLPPMKIYITGHSLGGAMAQLLAYDLALVLEHKPWPTRLCCYTFGAPRVGNHAWAADFTQRVPDTFHIVNDQDAVARAPKFIVLYKKAGHRVIINGHGDMLVRPTYVEQSMELIPGAGRVSQHLLGDYLRSLLAVMLSQFGRKRFSNGMQGVLRLAERSRPVQRLLLDRAGLSLAELRKMVATGPTHLPRIRPTRPKCQSQQDEERFLGGGVLCRVKQAGKRVLLLLRLAACLSQKGAQGDSAAATVAGGADMNLGLDDEEGMTVDMGSSDHSRHGVEGVDGRNGDKAPTAVAQPTEGSGEDHGQSRERARVAFASPAAESSPGAASAGRGHAGESKRHAGEGKSHAEAKAARRAKDVVTESIDLDELRTLRPGASE